MRYGMLIDLERCIGCNACTVTCKQKNATPPQTFWSRVTTTEIGEYPDCRRFFLPTPVSYTHLTLPTTAIV